MKKKKTIIKGIIFGTVAICAIASFAIYMHSQNKTKYYDENTVGNYAGNLYNNGYYCESDDRIYFKNMNDNGSLYSMDLNMDDTEKINSDNVSFINVNGPYIYYSRMNLDKKAESVMFNINCTGLYRCNLNGKSTINLYTNPTALVCQYGNNVYYQHYDKKEGLSLYKVGIDGNDEEKITDKAIVPGCFKDDKMYYSSVDNDHYIMSYDINSEKITTFLKKRTVYPLIFGEYMYYMDIDNDYRICRYPIAGGEPEVVIDERCSNYNLSISGKYLIYQTDANDVNYLFKLDLNTKEKTTLMQGSYENINITSNYVFFNEFDTQKCYYLENGTNVPKIFDPPSLK